MKKYEDGLALEMELKTIQLINSVTSNPNSHLYGSRSWTEISGHDDNAPHSKALGSWERLNLNMR